MREMRHRTQNGRAGDPYLEADLIDDDTLIWFALRERRGSLLTKANLPTSAARRQTFAAAMAQFEEQMTAAKVVSPATRPLNLYYGLAQAGMAEIDR